MMQQASSTNRHNAGPPHWINLQSPHATNYTPDEQIEHYNQWKSVAAEEFKTMFIRNLRQVAETIEKLIIDLHEINVHVLDAYLKQEHPFKISALLFVSEEEFLSDIFTDAYTLSRTAVVSISEEILQVEISFASKTEDLDEGAIYCDGYTLKRAKDDE